MREFYLKNGNGEMYSLMNTSHWLYEPKGLGLKMGSKYAQVGSDFIRTKKANKPKDITGTLLITGKNQYEKYHDFMLFTQIEPLVLIYKPGTVEYMADVSLDEIKKEEIDYKTGTLQADLTFKRLSRWRRVLIQRNDAAEVGGKLYTYKYPFRYGKDVANNVTVESDTVLESPCKITIIGTCENPTWRLYVNGVLSSTGTANVTLTEGQRIIIDTTKIPYSIGKYDSSNNLIADLYQFSDFATERFFFLQKGTNRISIGHDGTNALELAVEAHLEYETV